MFASQKNHEDLVQVLLDAGADVNVKGEEGWTALITATSFGHSAIVQLLLEAGADVNVQDWTGRTAADLAKTPDIRSLIDNYGM
mmetsp:Transcript_105152/g.206253  ORF Transcript_105152/g.206253 Transcript_105152/m.206253 type:complete len:84 (+) Transcript_105152:2647-2898(+)